MLQRAATARCMDWLLEPPAFTRFTHTLAAGPHRNLLQLVSLFAPHNAAVAPPGPVGDRPPGRRGDVLCADAAAAGGTRR